MKQTPGNSPQK